VIAALVIAALLAVDGSLEENGWTKARDCAGDVFRVSGGVLSMACSFNPYRGTAYSRKVKRFPERGELTYEVKLGGGASDGESCPVCFGRATFSFRADHFNRYFDYPEPNWKRVGEHKVPHDTWTKIKVVWDNAQEKIRYYAGDMEIPSAVEQGKLLSDLDEGVTIRVFNYGMDRSPREHCLRNFHLRELPPEKADERLPRTKALVFHGIGAEFQPIAEWTKGFAKDDVVNFYLEVRGSSSIPANKFALSAYPEESLIRRAKLIVLADMPLTEDVLDLATQENILKAKAEGAKVIVTEGLTGGRRNGNPNSPILREGIGVRGER